MDIHEIVKKLIGEIRPIGETNTDNERRIMDIHEIVTKLIGEINPVGETNTDNARFENLKAMTELVDELLSDIYRVARGNNRHEYSINRAGQFASSFLDEVRE